MPARPPTPPRAVQRRHQGLARIGTVTATTAVAAGGVTLAVATGLAVGHATSASGATTPAGITDAPTTDTAPGAPAAGGDGGLLPAQAPPHAQSHGS